MIKLTKRKGFNFFRSYFDVYNELETPEDKLAFIDALLDRQFMGIKPTNLKGMAKFAYISQTNSIDSQVKGFEDKTGIILNPTVGGSVGGCDTPTAQVEVEGKVEVKEKVKNNIPEFSVFLIYAKEQKPYIDEFSVKAKYESWLQNGWKDGNDKKIVNWKSKLANTLPYLKENKPMEKPDPFKYNPKA